MKNFMKNGAVIEPDSVKAMKLKTDRLAQDLEKTSKELISRTEYLNQAGFQDENFASLYNSIQEKKQDLDNLKKVMISFSEYLLVVEKNIRELVNSQKIKGKNLNIK